ncbi:MAG TPA: DUF4389 domain-containing protein [Thermohalobaculum sp.]|nr:DUF4389 domain-containing protein [Thermohalobaculum sp.]
MSGDGNGARGAGRGPVWRRGGIALVLLIAVEIGQLLMNVTAVLQFGWMLFGGRPNAFLHEFGQSLSRWLRQASAFVTCASEERPFPRAPWPRAE